MVPLLAIPATIAEGLLYFRRALTVYRVANQAAGVANTLDSLLTDDLRNHQSVIGEDAFFLLLGRETIIQFRSDLKKGPMSEKDLNFIVLSAMVNPVVQSASVDVNTSVAAFGHALGQELQLYDESTYDDIGKLLVMMDSGFAVKDPVLDYLTHVDHFPQALKTVLIGLGVNEQEIENLKDQVKNDVRTLEWRTMLEKVNSTTSAVHKLSTFLGYLAIGSKSVRTSFNDDITVTSGPDGLSLSTSFLPQSKSFPYKKESLSDIRGITKEMVDSASKRSMLDRGFVSTPDGWTKVERTTIVKDAEDGDDYQFTNALKSNATSIISKRLEHKLTALSRLTRIKAIRSMKGGSDD